MKVIQRVQIVTRVVVLAGGLAVLAGGCGGPSASPGDDSARIETERNAKDAMIAGGKDQSKAPKAKSAKDFMDQASRKQQR